jgi:hypothetical protein
MSRFTHLRLSAAVGAIALMCLSGCTTTTPVPGGTMTVKIPDLPETGFLGDYSKLQLVQRPEFAVTGRKAYMAPGLDLSSYAQVIIDEPSFQYLQSDINLTAEDRARLADYVKDWVQNKVKGRFNVTAVPGPGVLRVRTAITRVENPPKVPAATYQVADVGTMTCELELSDSVSKEVFLAMVDRMSGVRFTVAREDFSKEKEAFTQWMSEFDAAAQGAAVQAAKPTR